jgi:tetratricopeptide (TPR) repeat protein
VRARSILRTYLSHLRRALAPAGITITWQDVGYLLSIDLDLVDIYRFRRFFDQDCRAALILRRHHHNADGEAATLDSLGYIDQHTGRHTHAITHYRHALTLYRDLSHTHYTANTLDRLGHPHVALDQPEQARAVWREVLRLYREQGRLDAATRVQQQLDDLDQPLVRPEPAG